MTKGSRTGAAERQITLSVAGEEWTPVASLELYGTDDKVYTIERESGEIRFGDGVHGKKPATGSVISVSYRYGADDESNATSELSISLDWSPKDYQENESVSVNIEIKNDRIVFQRSERRRWPWKVKLCQRIKKVLFCGPALV